MIFGLNGGFSKGKFVILWGIFQGKICDFGVKQGISAKKKNHDSQVKFGVVEGKMHDFRVKWGISEEKMRVV